MATQCFELYFSIYHGSMVKDVSSISAGEFSSALHQHMPDAAPFQHPSPTRLFHSGHSDGFRSQINAIYFLSSG